MGISEGLLNIQNGLNGVTTREVVAGIIGTATGAALGAGAVALLSGKKSSSRRSSKSRAGRSRDRKFKSKQKWEQRYKRKRKFKVYKSHKNKNKKRSGVKYTKNGQPYIILSSGKARFIKKRGGKK